ncbi:membrane fusion protein (multidrug efflux system) [Stella humosa]|uniref:Membrane fusion protein (Multidrug efflux system) n=1 Tax=Stella humosa TaxID=94 RepID=A0A3N1KNM4_9PROT|nr:efflux RND transporter periplasmic adaptor subunit [Stella humosa]ROP80842.1 membrane fusion protein (multidrug efflux system) [Stella humosa]BBK33366.1 hemolysin D [Stella humosa]
MNFRAISVSLAGLLVLAACDQAPKKQAAPPPPPPAEVGVVTLAPQKVEIITELPGRTAPFRAAEVRPQVNGIILKRLFEEGSLVEAGQQLYQIDPASYQVALQSAQATLSRATAQSTASRLLAQRYKPLTEAKAVSRQDYDNAVASAQQAAADVASARAQIEAATISLQYTKVLAPITGRVGRSAVTEGALVTANQTAALATVQQLDPIYVDVTQSTADLLRLRRQMESGQLETDGAGQAPARLVLEDGSQYPLPGKLLFSEVTVSPGTGSVTLRAEFPNPKGFLLPGMFVHARLQAGAVSDALLIPQRGVSRDQRGQPIALLVGKDNKVEQRTLTVDRAIGDQWLVTGGVAAGDRVIVEGVQKVRPGAEVRVVAAKPVPAAGQTAAKPAAAK